MEAKKLAQTWAGINAENRYAKWIIGALAVANVLLAFKLVSRDEKVVLLPPLLEKQAELTQAAAGDTYKTAWGLFVASFIGNITPKNADFVKSNVGTYFSPSVYSELRDSIDASADALKNEGLSVSFSVTDTLYEPETDKVFVSGTTTTRARDNTAGESIERTYEFRISISNYRPIVTYFDIYRGPARTQARLASMPKQQDSNQ